MWYYVQRNWGLWVVWDFSSQPLNIWFKTWNLEFSAGRPVWCYTIRPAFTVRFSVSRPELNWRSHVISKLRKMTWTLLLRIEMLSDKFGTLGILCSSLWWVILCDVWVVYGSHLYCILLLVFEGQIYTSCMESKMTEKIVMEKRWSMNQENLINPVPAVTVAMHHQIQMTVQVQSYCIMLHELENKILGTMSDIKNLLREKIFRDGWRGMWETTNRMHGQFSGFRKAVHSPSRTVSVTLIQLIK